MSEHPLLRREIVVFMAPLPPGDPRPRFAAHISDGAGFLPIVFRGDAKASVIETAEQWRRGEVAKAEAKKKRRAA